MRQVVLVIFCIEDTTSAYVRDGAMFFQHDYHQLLKCRNVIAHYHSSTNDLPSQQIIVRDHGDPVHSSLKHDLTHRSFETLCMSSTREFPPERYEYVIAMQCHGYIDEFRTYTYNKTGKRQRVHIIKSTDMCDILLRCYHTKINAIILDNCYMSTLENAVAFMPVTDYLIASQSEMPYRGFVSCAKNLDTSIQTRDGLKRIVKDFVCWHRARSSELCDDADGTLLHLPHVIAFLRSCNRIKINVGTLCTINDSKLHDVVCLFRPSKKSLKKFIVFRMQHSKPGVRTTSGISLSLQ